MTRRRSFSSKRHTRLSSKVKKSELMNSESMGLSNQSKNLSLSPKRLKKSK
jgi:hypothetical protein